MSSDNLDEDLIEAVRNGDLENVKALLLEGASVNVTISNRSGDRLLHIANTVEIVKELVMYGANVNMTNKYYEIPLHAAITLSRSVDIVKELLKYTENVNSKSRKHNTPLNHAVKKKNINLSVVKELLKHGADINIKNKENRLLEHNFTPLDNAVFHDLECAKVLIKYTIFREFRGDCSSSYIINLTPYETKECYDDLLSYQEDCVRELVKMMTNIIVHDLSLLEITKNGYSFHRFVPYYNEVSTILSSTDYTESYPIYYEIISDNLKPFRRRTHLLKKLQVINMYVRVQSDNPNVRSFLSLDYASTFHIAEYLSNQELSNVIIAFSDP